MDYDVCFIVHIRFEIIFPTLCINNDTFSEIWKTFCGNAGTCMWLKRLKLVKLYGITLCKFRPWKRSRIQRKYYVISLLEFNFAKIMTQKPYPLIHIKHQLLFTQILTSPNIPSYFFAMSIGWENGTLIFSWEDIRTDSLCFNWIMMTHDWLPK